MQPADFMIVSKEFKEALHKALPSWKEYCPSCKKHHVVTLQPCPECGVYHTPQPKSDIVWGNCNADMACEGCKAYRDHLSII
jgi:hypothetical protein